MNNITLIGIDLAKNVFQLCGLNKAHKVQFNKSVSRAQLVREVAKYPSARLVMEACGGAHHWARLFSEMGHEVSLVPAQHVKALTRGNKSDAHDALAIAETSMRPQLHPVPVKTLEQHDYQLLLRIRTRHKQQRTGTVNQVRGILTEYGLVLPNSIGAFTAGIPEILEQADNGLTPIARSALNDLYQSHLALTEQIVTLDKQLRAIAVHHPIMNALMNLRGIGPITAVALFAGIGQGNQFTNARQLAAWIGLVPKQRGTGGKMMLGSISKRGNTYLRLLLIHGARTVMNWMKNKTDELSL